MELTFKNSVKNLLNAVPEFKESADFKQLYADGNQDNQYLIFGILKNFYQEKFLEKNVDLVKKASNFLESLSSSSDIKLQELVAYGFLENFDNNLPYFEKLSGTFGENTKRLFVDTKKFWNS